MNCSEFERRLEIAVEQRAPIPPGAVSHAEHCAVCGPLVDSHLLLERAVEQWAAIPVEVDVTARVVEQICLAAPANRAAAERGGRSGRSPSSGNAQTGTRGSRAVLATIAAVLLVLLTPLLFQPGSSDPAVKPRIAENADGGSSRTAQNHTLQDRTVPGAVEQPLPLSGLVRNASSAGMGLFRGAARSLSEARVLVPPADIRLVFDRHDQPPATAPETWTDDWNRSFRPMSKRFGEAVGFLWKAIPLGDPGA